MLRNGASRWLGIAGLVVLVTTATAQERQGRGGAGGPGAGAFGGAAGGKVALVQIQQVQQELELNDDQKKQVREISEKVREASPRRAQGATGEGDRAQRRDQMQMVSRVVAEQEKKLDEVLNEDQRKRLEEISLQLTGVRALSRDEVAGKLNLSDQQKEKLQSMLREQRGQAGRGEGQQRPNLAAMRERRQQTEQQMLEVLTEEQKQKWEELKGKPFQFGAGRGATAGRDGAARDGARRRQQD
jgi:hypothetical protein